MKNLVHDDLAIADERRTRKAPRAVAAPKNLGNLHALLVKGLPDLLDGNGVLDTRKLAKHAGVSFQAIYKWFEREQIPTKRIAVMLALSKSQKTGGAKFKPLVRDDFWEFFSH